MLSSDVGKALGDVVLRCEIAVVFLDDRLSQIFDAPDGRVLRKVGLNRLDAGLLDVFGSRKIRLARSEVDHINALLAQFHGGFHDGHRLRYRDTRYSACQLHWLIHFLESLS